jgi:two-component system capsular synthesis sensor histidine kinase RcsC
VLSDVNMPRINGYELAHELRRLGCEVPIIGATANAMRGEEALCLAAGMNHCLVKPFTLQALHNQLAPYERTPS